MSTKTKKFQNIALVAQIFERAARIIRGEPVPLIKQEIVETIPVKQVAKASKSGFSDA